MGREQDMALPRRHGNTENQEAKDVEEIAEIHKQKGQSTMVVDKLHYKKVARSRNQDETSHFSQYRNTPSTLYIHPTTLPPFAQISCMSSLRTGISQRELKQHSFQKAKQGRSRVI